MNSLNAHTVVDRMVAELAERRLSRSGRRAAYIALAQAILNDDSADLAKSAAHERHHVTLGTQSAVAA